MRECFFVLAEAFNCKGRNLNIKCIILSVGINVFEEYIA